jgi:hypothetical protein
MFTLDIVHSDIPFLSAFPDRDIVRQLLAGVRKFPAYDHSKVTKATDLIVCEFYRNGMQVARVRALLAESPRTPLSRLSSLSGNSDATK